MQIGGIGSEHNTHMHHVTNCMHESPATKKPKGGMAASNNALQQTAQQALQGENNAFSLSDFFNRMFGSTKRLFGRIWGGDGDKDRGTVTDSADEQEMAELAASAIPVNEQDGKDRINNNPFFTPVMSTAEPSHNIIQKAKLKVHRAAGYLAKHFSFSGRNSFDARHKEQKEDLRRKSRYRENEMEIECTITDDSYLLDSYDRKGEYSKLSTKL